MPRGCRPTRYCQGVAHACQTTAMPAAKHTTTSALPQRALRPGSQKGLPRVGRRSRRRGREGGRHPEPGTRRRGKARESEREGRKTDVTDVRVFSPPWRNDHPSSGGPRRYTAWRTRQELPSAARLHSPHRFPNPYRPAAPSTRACGRPSARQSAERRARSTMRGTPASPSGERANSAAARRSLAPVQRADAQTPPPCQ